MDFKLKVIAGAFALMVVVVIIIVVLVSIYMKKKNRDAGSTTASTPGPSVLLSSQPPALTTSTPVTVVIPTGITAPPMITATTKPMQEISQPIRSSGCEGDTAMFSCPAGKTIQLTNAFYGRNSPNVCPGPNSDKTTTCVAPGAQSTLAGLVNGKNIASVKMANVDAGGPFVDPCNGIYKHYDVTYNCA